LTKLFSDMKHDLTSDSTVLSMVMAARDDLCVNRLDKTDLTNTQQQEGLYVKVINRVHNLKKNFRKAAEG